MQDKDWLFSSDEYICDLRTVAGDYYLSCVFKGRNISFRRADEAICFKGIGIGVTMKINCIWEHNGNDSLLHAENYVGAFARGENVHVALQKMKKEIQSYSAWLGEKTAGDIESVIVQEKESELEIKDADSDVIFMS